VGRTFSIWGGRRVLAVVGVVRDIKVASLRESAVPYYYVPLAQFFNTDTGVAVHLRTSDDPLAHLSAVRAEVRALDPNVLVFEALTLEEFTSASRFAQKAAASLLGVLSTMALALTALGLYGVLSFAVAQRTAEIGVRLALGARPADIARLVLQRGGILVALGLGAGGLASLGVTRLLAAAFYGLRPFEPAMLLAVVPPLLLAALAACLLPARRATKVDPLVALRAD
jgi:putative ABC transport system permease protein